MIMTDKLQEKSICIYLVYRESRYNLINLIDIQLCELICFILFWISDCNIIIMNVSTLLPENNKTI